MDLGLEGKRILVTGSSSGIGWCIATAFMTQGCKVAFNGRDERKLFKAIPSSGNCIGIVGDVTDPSQAVMMVNECTERLGGIDVLVCNVGSGRSVPPGQENFQEWQQALSINLLSCTNVVEAAIEELSKSAGVVVCISSICGCEVVRGAPVTYSASKAALNAYVRGISIPLSERGIRINGVAPGNILFKDSVWDRKMKEDSLAVENLLRDNVPLQKLGSPDDVARFVVWLSSPLSNFVTGSIHVIDGGQTRG